jgi:hypothetical protein
MVGAGRFELDRALFTKPLKTKDDPQQQQRLKWYFALTLGCTKKQQNPFRMIEKDR